MDNFGSGSSLALASLKKILSPTILAWDRRTSLSYAGLRRRKERRGRRRRNTQAADCRCWSICGSITGRADLRAAPSIVGLCPLHEETRPSFYVNTRKDVFYCHGCGQGGDLIRFVQLSRQSVFPPEPRLPGSTDSLQKPMDSAAVLEQAAAFYQQQLDHYPEALSYLDQRGLHDPALIRELDIGYAPGGILRRSSHGARSFLRCAAQSSA